MIDTAVQQNLQPDLHGSPLRNGVMLPYSPSHKTRLLAFTSSRAASLSLKAFNICQPKTANP